MPMPNKPAKKLLPDLLDKIKPVKKQMINGVYQGKKKLNTKLRIEMINNFIMNIVLIYDIVIKISDL